MSILDLCLGLCINPKALKVSVVLDDNIGYAWRGIFKNLTACAAVPGCVPGWLQLASHRGSQAGQMCLLCVREVGSTLVPEPQDPCPVTDTSNRPCQPGHERPHLALWKI